MMARKRDEGLVWYKTWSAFRTPTLKVGARSTFQALPEQVEGIPGVHRVDAPSDIPVFVEPVVEVPAEDIAAMFELAEADNGDGSIPDSD
jgi:hypothetical protein